MFSGDVLTKSLLPRTLAALGMETKNVTVTDAVTYFRWLHGLQSARPVKKVFLPWSHRGGKLEQIVYHSRRLCYIISARDGSHVEILGLETGKRSFWFNDARHYLREVTLSDRYVVMVLWAR